MKNSDGLVLIIYDFSEVPKLGSLKINFVKYLREKKRSVSYVLFNKYCIASGV